MKISYRVISIWAVISKIISQRNLVSYLAYYFCSQQQTQKRFSGCRQDGGGSKGWEAEGTWRGKTIWFFRFETSFQARVWGRRGLRREARGELGSGGDVEGKTRPPSKLGSAAGEGRARGRVGEVRAGRVLNPFCT